MRSLLWSSPSVFPQLCPDQVHVWRVSLAVNASQRQKLWQILSPEEQERAKKFHRDSDQAAFVGARGWLRSLLGQYLQTDPQRLAFRYGPQGKPALISQAGNLRFNLSHASGLALYAFTIAQEVGIDVEQVRSNLNYRAIARRFFSPEEQTCLDQQPAADRAQTFFQLWTHKEAWIKAQGGSIFQTLDQPQPCWQPLSKDSLTASASPLRPHRWHDWFLYDLEPAPGYVAALVVAGPPAEVQLWQP